MARPKAIGPGMRPPSRRELKRMLYQANSALKKDPQDPQLYLERATAHIWMNMNRPCPTSTGR